MVTYVSKLFFKNLQLGFCFLSNECYYISAQMRSTFFSFMIIDVSKVKAENFAFFKAIHVFGEDYDSYNKNFKTKLAKGKEELNQ